MNNKIKKLIFSVFFTVSAITLIFFLSLLINYESMSKSFIDSLTYSLSFLSILVTGAAAIVAAGLVSNWKVEHNYSKINDFLIEMIDINNSVKQGIHEVRDSKLVKSLKYFEPKNDNQYEFWFELHYEIKNKTKTIRKNLENLKDIQLKILLLNNKLGCVFISSKIDSELLNECGIYTQSSSCLYIIEELLDIIDYESYNLYLSFATFEAGYYEGNQEIIIESLKNDFLVKTIRVLYRDSELYFDSINLTRISSVNSFNIIFDLLNEEIIKNIMAYKIMLDKDSEN